MESLFSCKPGRGLTFGGGGLVDLAVAVGLLLSKNGKGKRKGGSEPYQHFRSAEKIGVAPGRSGTGFGEGLGWEEAANDSQLQGIKPCE